LALALAAVGGGGARRRRRPSKGQNQDKHGYTDKKWVFEAGEQTHGTLPM